MRCVCDVDRRKARAKRPRRNQRAKQKRPQQKYFVHPAARLSAVRLQTLTPEQKLEAEYEEERKAESTLIWDVKDKLNK